MYLMAGNLKILKQRMNGSLNENVAPGWNLNEN